MKLIRDGSRVNISRDGDKRAPKESTFYSQARDKLNALDGKSEWIRINQTGIGKRGHLYGAPFMLENKRTKQLIYDNYYAIRLAHEDYNKGETVDLWTFEQKDNTKGQL